MAGMDGQQIYGNFTNGDTTGLRDAAERIDALTKSYGDRAQSIKGLQDRMKQAWTGSAADAAGAGAGPLEQAFIETAQPLDMTRASVEAQVSSFDSSGHAVVPVPPKPDKPSPWSLGLKAAVPIAGPFMAADEVNSYQDGVAKHNAANDNNVRVMDQYGNVTTSTKSVLPTDFGTLQSDGAAISIKQATPPGHVGPYPPPDARGKRPTAVDQQTSSSSSSTSVGTGTGPGSGDTGTGNPTGPSGSGSGSGSSGSSGDGAVRMPVGSGTTPSGTPAGGGGGTGLPGAGRLPAGTGTGGPAGKGRGPGGVDGVVFTPGGSGGKSGGPGPAFGGTDGTGTGPGGRGSAGGRLVGGDLGESSGGRSSAGGRGGGLGGTAGEGAGGRGVAGENARGLGRGSGMGSLGNATAAEAAAARAAGARGANGAGGPMGAGRRGEDDEDGEHRRPDFLIEPDPEAFFGTDQRTTPSVIGE
jgi:hypothetical protein